MGFRWLFPMGFEALVLFVTALNVAAGARCGAGLMERNLALHQTARQISSFFWRSYDRSIARTWDAYFAVDGKWNAILGLSPTGVVQSQAHTGFVQYAWWRVDLGSTQIVSEVWITNRADCCGERLANFYVGVTDDIAVAQAPTPVPPNYEVCYYHRGAAAQGRRFRMVCDQLLTGRYVIVQLTGKNYLQLAEVEVYADSYLYDNNLAMGKPAFQSSNANAMWTADRAVDGSWNMLFDRPLPCSRTKSERNAWWSVDLGSSQPVSEVWISSRFHSADQLADFFVGVTNDSPQTVTPVPYLSSYEVCSHYTTNLPSATRERVICDKPLAGRYVIIQLGGTNVLTLCEVEVYSELEDSSGATLLDDHSLAKDEKLAEKETLELEDSSGATQVDGHSLAEDEKLAEKETLENAVIKQLHPLLFSVDGDPKVWERAALSASQSVQKMAEEKTYKVLDIVQKYKRKYKVKWSNRPQP